MRRDIWDDGREGSGALVWPAVVGLAILTGIIVGQKHGVALGVVAGLVVFVAAFWRVYKRG